MDVGDVFIWPKNEIFVLLVTDGSIFYKLFRLCQSLVSIFLVGFTDTS